MLGIIANNFLQMRKGWNVAKKYAATVAYVGTHFFPNFKKTLDLIVMHVIT